MQTANFFERFHLDHPCRSFQSLLLNHFKEDNIEEGPSSKTLNTFMSQKGLLHSIHSLLFSFKKFIFDSCFHSLSKFSI